MPKMNLLFSHLVVVLLCFFSAHFADAKAESIRCNLSATVIGDSHYFWAYGRDSWTGSGIVSCGSEMHAVRVLFSSWGAGVGAGANSVLSLSINGLRTTDYDSVIGSFRTFRPDVNATNWDGSLSLNVETASTNWPLIVRSIGKEYFDIATTIYFGQITIQSIPEEK